MGRLPTHVEVAGLLRRVSADGDFASVLKKGDPERGALLLVVTCRGRHLAILERTLELMSGDYRWRSAGPGDSAGSEQIGAFLAARARSDPDLWVVELDIAEAERFIAETTSAG